MRTLKTPWREEAIMPPKNMNKHIPERRGGKMFLKRMDWDIDKYSHKHRVM